MRVSGKGKSTAAGMANGRGATGFPQKLRGKLNKMRARGEPRVLMRRELDESPLEAIQVPCRA
jgi:hypothetical protein